MNRNQKHPELPPTAPGDVPPPDVVAKRLDDLREVTAIQCAPGNYDADPYMLGMANGLLVAESIMRGCDDVVCKDAPAHWRNGGRFRTLVERLFRW